LDNYKIKKKFNFQDSLKRCFEYRKSILNISQTVPALHLGGALSSVEILDLIYFGLMNSNKKVIDKFIMSKGHSCILQYIILNKLGIISNKQLNGYCKKNGILGCHPDYGNPGINASTGSLGHGMGLAAGIAQAYKIKKKKSKIFVLISDGELQEGSTWEAMMMAANLELDNLVCFLDHNGSQSFGSTKITHPKFYPILEKVKSFNWKVSSVNGHCVEDILKEYSKISKNKMPKFLICNTVKGKGVKYMENKPIWHYRSPNREEYKIAIQDLKKINK
jgi:transketolase